MSKFRNGLMKRVMAVILSGAMVMSSMTSYAAEINYDIADENVETASQSSEPEAEETVSLEAEKTDEEADTAIESETAAATESTASTATETVPAETQTDSSTEAAAPEEETTSAETQTDSSVETEETTETTEVTETTEIASETEVLSETETVEEESTEEMSTELESEEEETTEESQENEAAAPDDSMIDLKNGLKKGQIYGDQDILKISVLEDFKGSGGTTIDDVKYNNSAAGSNNPLQGSANISASVLIPDKGAAFKIEAIKASKITFAVGDAKGKIYYFAKDNGGGSGTCISSGAVSKNDTYTFKMDAGNTYYFCLGGSKIKVYGIKWVERDLEAEQNRPDWNSEVAAPKISSVAVDGSDKGKVIVMVDAVIGDKGADKVEAFMYDADGNQIGDAESVKEREQTKFEFFPPSTGSYTFKAAISRNDEKTKIESEASAPFDFTLPLVVPEFKGTTNLGDGQVELKWDIVPEADKYIVESVSNPELGEIESANSSIVIKDLTVGQKYSFTVYAMRGEEKTEKSKPVEIEVTKEKKLNWEYSTYGNGTSKGKDTVTVDEKEGSVRIEANSGKIVPASNDGLTFYYTQLDPNTTNFTFSAKVHVNSWTYSNGQEGFGLMVSDSVGKEYKQYWTNSYQAVVSRVSYRWNGVAISEDGSGQRIDMQLGVGSTEKTGVTPKDQKDIANGVITAPRKFSAETSSIDTTFAKYGDGQYNIVKNYKNNPAPKGSDHEQYEDFELQIQKNNTGYFVSYTNPDGNTTLKKYYDPKALNLIESDTIYVGVFASRNADVTFTDIKLDTISPEDDEPAEEKPIKIVNASNSIVSGGLTNSPEYTFAFASNWYGKLVLKDSEGNILSRHKEKDENGNEVELDYYDVKGTLDPDLSTLLDGDNARDTKVCIELNNLSVGKNVYTVEFTPNKDWSPSQEVKADGTVRNLVQLKSYDMVRITHTVEYKKYGEEGQTIYVSQEGKSTNIGTKESPLDIYTAVRYALPGQTIILAGGRYSLNRTLQIPKGINGRPDIVDGKETYKNYIKMIGDPNSSERPVLDFNSLVAAVVTVGDYWYFKNFDVIRCKDGEKGIQVSGSYCVFDRVDTYKNGSTGLQICRASGTDTYKDWPEYNLILNCNSYLNVDSGYEDADGFAAKLTSGSGNVFDGCIAAFNADDGWDLFSKAQTGSIGAVTIRNSIAYRNGYVLFDENDNLDENGRLVLGKGNGNGFKMGGDGLKAGTMYDPDYDPDALIPESGHKLYNSLSFGNKSKGIASNNAPNIKVYNSVSCNNGAQNDKGSWEGSNIGFSAYDTNPHTDYELRNVISFRTEEDKFGIGDSVVPRGQQDDDKINGKTAYYWSTADKAAKNANGDKITADSFVSLTYDSLNRVDKDYWRNADGTVNTHDFLKLKDDVLTGDKPEDNPSMGGSPSIDIEDQIGEDTDGSITGGSSGSEDDASLDYGEDYPAGGINEKEHYGKIWVADIKYVDYTDKEPIYYTGKKIEPEVHVRFSADTPLLVKGKGYNLKFSNNVNAGTATVNVIGATHYVGFTATKTFEILPVDINDNSISIPSSVAVAQGGDVQAAVKPTWQGKALKKDVEYTVSPVEGEPNKLLVKGIGNFTGEKVINAYTVSADKLMSKASVAILAEDKNPFYTGEECKPRVEVKMNGSVLTTGYSVEYANNIEIGKATLTVVGDGVTYFGSKSVGFSIKGGNLKNVAEVTDKKGTLTSYVANGVTFNGRSCAIPENTIEVKLKGKDITLKNGTDYKIVQKGTDKAGSATVTIKGINNYSGAVNYKYKISPLDVNDASVEITHPKTLEYAFTGAQFIPEQNFNIRINNTIVESSNYKLTYKNNNLVGENVATVTVAGQKGLTGKKDITFSISKASMTDNIDFSVTAKEITTGGKDLKYSDLRKAGVGVTQSINKKNKKLSAGRDYDKDAIKYYIDTNDNYEIDDKDIEITSKITSNETVNEFKEKGYLTILVRVEAMESNPKCFYTGHADGYFRAAMWNIAKVRITNIKPRVFGRNYKKGNGQSTPMTWTDTEVAKLEDYITFKYWTDKEEVLTCQDLIGAYTYDSTYLDKDGFAIVPNSYKKNNQCGTASFMIKGTGKFAGTKKVTFSIVNLAVAEKMKAAGKPVEE